MDLVSIVTNPWFILAAVVATLVGAGVTLFVFIRQRQYQSPKKQPPWVPELEQRLLDAFSGQLQAALDGLVLHADENRRRNLEQAAEFAKIGQQEKAREHLKACFYPGMPASEACALDLLIGNSYLSQGDLPQAQGRYEEVLRASDGIQEETERTSATAADLGNLGLIYRTRGDLDKASVQ